MSMNRVSPLIFGHCMFLRRTPGRRGKCRARIMLFCPQSIRSQSRKKTCLTRPSPIARSPPPLPRPLVRSSFPLLITRSSLSEQTTGEFSQLVASDDVTLHIVEGGLHELHNDSHMEDTIGTMCRWLQARMDTCEVWRGRLGFRFIRIFSPVSVVDYRLDCARGWSRFSFSRKSAPEFIRTLLAVCLETSQLYALFCPPYLSSLAHVSLLAALTLTLVKVYTLLPI